MMSTLLHLEDQAYMEFTGRLAYKSTCGNKYILIAHHVYSNAILGILDLIATLKRFYNVSLDWSCKNYSGLTLDWHYDLNYLDISIPSYIPTVLTCLR